MDENVSNFAGITGASPEVARTFLEMTGGNFERAIELFYESPDLATGVGAGLSSNTPPSRPEPPASRSNIGREDAAGVIHIDSDDDDDDEDMDMEFEDESDQEADNETAIAAQAAALAQEEEDAAMAKRLQEELYSENRSGPGLGDDSVRAPIARTTETLVAPGSYGIADESSWRTDYLNELRGRAQRGAASRGGGPFAQRIWGDGTSQPSTTENGSHARRLEDLFRPPYELMARMDWDEARSLGKEDKKWIMVNLQDMTDFNCQALNRDIWKDRAIHSLVSENFIFLQYDKDYPDAQEYLTFYFPNRGHENPDNYPHVSIIDPRTGEQVKVWSGRPFPSPEEFHAALAEFLDRYSLAANSKNPVAKSTARKPPTIDVDRMTEEEMLEMALKNSLAGEASSRSTPTPNVHDPDALTKSPQPPQRDEGKGKEPERPVQQSPFAKISSMYPHTEPENNPATTTRIQFRHPNGRVIRRFSTQDPVRRIYEWLKAEPLEGKEGIEFELKKMPQGQDLVDLLSSTIEQAGLKQGTVMIEFIED